MKRRKGSLSARPASAPSVDVHAARLAARAAVPKTALLDLEGYDFTDFAAFLQTSDPVWVSGVPSTEKGGSASS